MTNKEFQSHKVEITLNLLKLSDNIDDLTVSEMEEYIDYLEEIASTAYWMRVELLLN